MSPLVNLQDAASDRDKVQSAAERFRIEVVTDDGEMFTRAFDMLDGFFGPKGELEPRADLARFTRDPVLSFGDGMEGHYRLIVALDGDELVGVRDCYVDLDRNAGVCIAALSHSFVAPSQRRSGLAALFRTVPVTLARTLATQHLGPSAPVLVAAEMEPVDPDDIDSIVRLLAYSRSGFSVMDPARLPYSQPDFRDLLALGAEHTALPLMPVVRWVGSEDSPSLPVPLAAAFARLFHACHRLYLPRERVDPSEVHALRALARQVDPVRLLPLPRDMSQIGLLAPLLRSAVLPLYPRILQGSNPEFRDAAAELARLLARLPGDT